MKLIKIIFILILFLPVTSLAGNDTLIGKGQNSTTRFFSARQFEYEDSTQHVGYSLYNFQNYLLRTHLGNNGLAMNRLYFQSMPIETGFNYFINNFEYYFYTPENLKFYNTKTPYTDLFYVLGSKLEQLFKMSFSYNIKKNWNVTADFSRIRSEGFYQRQSTNNNFISASSNYKSYNNRYYLLAGIFYNQVKNSENGGIVNDSIFETDASIDKKLLDVHLSSAKRKTINRSVFFKQYLNFGRKSTDTVTHNAIIPRSRLILTSLFNDNILIYEDDNPLSDFYSDIYYDSTKTFDSTYNYKIENELTWKLTDNKKHRGIKDLLGIGLRAKHQYVHVHQREIDTAFNNLIAGAEFYNTYSNHKFWWKVIGKYVLSGYNVNDYTGSVTIKKNITDSLSSLFLKIETRQQTPDFIYDHFSSNHFKWNNSFEKAQANTTTIGINMNRWDLAASISYTEHSHILYFDNYAVARQYNGSVGILSAYLKKDFEFYNWHLNNSVNYQYVPDSMVIRLPSLILEHSLFYENNLFKGAMRLQVGASVFYTSEYYANSYMPATAQFYLQDEKKYGGYPFIDFFINAKIKTVRVFLKIDHLNSGWMNTKPILTAGYPVNDRAFKFGVSWKFFN